jgi:glutathione peroxidase
MKTLILGLAVLAAIAAFATTSGDKTIYDFKMKNIDGKETPLSQYKGKVLLVVNVASKCGNTPQYAVLEKLYEEKKDKGFAVLGFPANEFGAQEPGTDSEIKEFCTSMYGVKFPMFSKIVVKGEGTHPLYKWLTESVEPKKEIEWNFAKFLVGRDGKVIARFGARTKPDSPEVLEAIDKAIAQK